MLLPQQVAVEESLDFLNYCRKTEDTTTNTCKNINLMLMY
jgi:hypothetical protein